MIPLVTPTVFTQTPQARCPLHASGILLHTILAVVPNVYVDGRQNARRRVRPPREAAASKHRSDASPTIGGACVDMDAGVPTPGIPTRIQETIMPLTASKYGKGRVRVMRLARDGDHHTPRELSLTVLMKGAFDAAWTAGDNRACIATDSVKNIVNVTAAKNLSLDKELFAKAVAKMFLDTYEHIDEMLVEAEETRWIRQSFGGELHGHTFTLDGNGTGYVKLVASRGRAVMQSGLRGFTFMKTTRSGWVDFVDDEYRTLADTSDRIAATAMDATWTWSSPPADYTAANGKLLGLMIAVFGTTYSHGVQDSMYRMGEAVLAAIPEVAEISFAMPNKHYIPTDLKPFGVDNPGTVFSPTDEPHGQIEATIGRAG